jgi:pimeloyl-ACP methyl ester carboxylesterase
MQFVPSQLRSLPPIWRETMLPAAAAGLLVDPIFRGQGMPAGHGRPLLLIPGYLAGDRSLATMAGWLRRAGYRTERAGIRLNVGCGGTTVARLEQRLEQLYERSGGRRVTIIGQSRGGAHARALAGRRPELVSGVVALGSPLIHPLMIHPLVRANVELVARLGTLGLPGLLRNACLDGPCCEPLRESLRAPLPDDVGYVSIYSRNDGIVDWRACLDPGARHVEVDATHLGMGFHAPTYRAIAAALRDFRDAELGAEPLDVPLAAAA